MPYTQQIKKLEQQLQDLKSKQRKHDMVINEKQKIYLIEEGVDELGEKYLICSDYTGLNLNYIDEHIEDGNETNEYWGFKEWSFRLSSKPENEYGL